MPRFSFSRLTDTLPVGLLVILVLATVSSAYILLRPEKELEGSLMWTFVQRRSIGYRQLVEEWGLTGKDHVRIELVEGVALRRRLLSGFFSGTPLADILEVERVMAASTWRGPLEAVGFYDLTDRLKEEGLFDKINLPSFSSWTNRGHIFGLPADVHPVLLCYRADVFEAAGIDVEELTTWDKFFEATAPLVRDLTGDGRPDQYVLEVQESTNFSINILILQAGGQLFDLDDQPVLNSEINVRVLSKMAKWAAFPNKMTGDLDLFSGSSHQLRADGYVLSWLVPDWRAIQMEEFIGSLAGKLKLMPLPAWEEGGRRTSSMGGSMIGIPKTTNDFEKNWEFAKRLYLSRELAHKSWKEYGVLTPVKEFWEDPIFDEPNAYYSNQPKGRLFIDVAEYVPFRTSSPFQELGRSELGHAFNQLIRYANEQRIDSAEQLEPKARELLQVAQNNILRQMRRNVFLDLSQDTP